jgi:EAL domain-containing protein (putative c-di-GMP-specific phosphodiesterase class I)
MALPWRRPASAERRILLLAQDPRLAPVVFEAAARMRLPAPMAVASGTEALVRLVAPGRHALHLVAEAGAAGSLWPHLLDAASDSGMGRVVVVGARPGQVWHGTENARMEAESIVSALGVTHPAQPAPTAADLLKALRRQALAIRYQPRVRLRDRRLVGVEALVRWPRAAGLLGPAAFVPLAEAVGLGRMLSMTVARQALGELAALRRRLPISVSLNLPLATLQQGDVPGWLRGLMRPAGFRAADVAIELTETTEVRDRSALRRALRRLEAAGHPVLMDDLTLGDPRLRLLRLPFSGVKLDRSLVCRLPHERRARAQAEQIVRLAHRRGMRVTAEGVADAAVWDAVRATGADLAQGFAVGRPMPLRALLAWVGAWHGRRIG